MRLLLAPLWEVGGSFAGLKVFGLRVQAVIIFIDLQYFLPTDDDESLINGHTQHLIHRQQLPLADAAGFTVFRGVVGDPPGPKPFGLAGIVDGNLAVTVP